MISISFINIYLKSTTNIFCTNFHYILGTHGVAHAEDLKYFWTYYPSLSQFPASDVKTIERYVGLLTNFAKSL